jgi:carbonic anhydrase/acetyltransferase-like protein (isoleucine patch superfamily)
MIHEFKGNKPKIAKNCFIAPSAEIIGDVSIGEGSSVWFNATLRADMNSITIGKNVSVQDNCVMHADMDGPVDVADNVAIGHGAIVHSCKIGSNCIIGMGSTILSGAKIGNNCIVGAGSVVTEGKEIPDNSIVMGIPAKVVKQITEEHMLRIRRNIGNYKVLNAEYLKKENFEEMGK